jgi:hypothetical protein
MIVDILDLMSLCMKKRGAAMDYPENKIGLAVSRKIVSQSQSEKLIKFFGETKFIKRTGIAIVFGAIAFISILGAFGAAIGKTFGSAGLLSISILYAVIAGFFSWFLIVKREKRFAGGISALIAVAMFPFVIAALEQILGLWPDNIALFQGYHFWAYGSWLMIELTTIGAGCIAVALTRCPFIIIPVLLSLWHFSMDLSSIIARQHYAEDSSSQIGSMIFSIVLLAVSFIADRRTREDYSFWGYLFGCFALIAGISSMELSPSVQIFGVILFTVIFFTAAFFLERRLLFIMGSFSLFAVVSFFLTKIFTDATVLFFCLSAFGAAQLSVFFLYLRKENDLFRSFENKIPGFLRKKKPYYRSYGFLSRR